MTMRAVRASSETAWRLSFCQVKRYSACRAPCEHVPHITLWSGQSPECLINQQLVVKRKTSSSNNAGGVKSFFFLSTAFFFFCTLHHSLLRVVLFASFHRLHRRPRFVCNLSGGFFSPTQPSLRSCGYRAGLFRFRDITGQSLPVLMASRGCVLR
jgi:hypothetical protein